MKSLPNIIKSNCVLFADNDVKVIDSNEKGDFFPICFRNAVEIESDFSDSIDSLANDNELYQMNHHQNSTQNLQEMKAYAESIIENAQKEAEIIRSDALLSVQNEIALDKRRAEQEGYQQGLIKGEQEINAKLASLDEKEKVLLKEYDNKLKDMQENVTLLLIALVQKITGVIIEEKSIITYLVCDAVKSQSTCNEFRISVSKADYNDILLHMDDIKDLVRSNAQVTIIENPELEKNQCKIETDKNIIDCSIETKLNNLAMALKLLM